MMDRKAKTRELTIRLDRIGTLIDFNRENVTGDPQSLPNLLTICNEVQAASELAYKLGERDALLVLERTRIELQRAFLPCDLVKVEVLAAVAERCLDKLADISAVLRIGNASENSNEATTTLTSEISPAETKQVPRIIQFAHEHVLVRRKLTDALPQSADDFSREVHDILEALAVIQLGVGDPTRDVAQAITTLRTQLTRVDNAFGRFREAMRRVHSQNMPEFNGRAVFSYHEAAVDVCAERAGWLWLWLSKHPPLYNLVADTDEGIAEQAANVAAQWSEIANAWNFEIVDVDDLKVRVAVESKRYDTSTSKPTATLHELSVEVEREFVILNGQKLDCTSKQALRWLKVMIDRPNEWLAPEDFKRADPELDGARGDRLKNKLPPKVAALIESRTGTGNRLMLDLA